MKAHFSSKEHVKNFVEIVALNKISSHKNIINLLEILYDEPTGRLALVFELMDKNFYEAIKGRKKYLPEFKVKCWMYQLICAVEFMHSKNIFHRDIKPENILIRDDTIKLADFGSCRGMEIKPPYTEYISTRWYRAPECLLTDGFYNSKMDIWGIACVFFELLTLYPLFPGENDEIDQIYKIIQILGTPPNYLLEKWKKLASHLNFNFPFKKGTGIKNLFGNRVSEECIDLIKKMLHYDPDERLSAYECKYHPYFKDLRDIENKRKRQISIKNRRKTREISNDKDSSKSSLSIKNKNKINNSIINIKINTNNTRKTMNLNIDIKNQDKLKTYEKYSDESDNDLPPIKKNKESYRENKNKKPKKLKKILNNLNSENNNSINNLKIDTHMIKNNFNKKITEHKKNYMSPYSLKVFKNNLGGGE